MNAIRSTLCCALLVAATGCVDNDSTLFIAQVQARTVDNECVVTNDPEGGFITRGALDPLLQTTYMAAMLVGNQLVRRGDADRLRTESARIQLYQADVEVYDFEANLLDSFSQPIAGFVDVGTGTDPGWGVTDVMLVSENASLAAAAAGGGEVVSQVKIYGETLGGLEVETGFWTFPVVICPGCVTIVEPESCEDDFVGGCFAGQDTSEIDARRVYANHICNQAPQP